MITKDLHLFDAFGVELEYMIVDRESLSVLPAADRVLEVAGDDTEVEHGELCWSNELVMHVLEFKTNGPSRSLGGLAERFQAGIVEANERLAMLGARLMPTAMHPWMDPYKETVLWPHGNREIYEAFDGIFGCKGHGWSNLQSAHLNLPFHGDEEFGRLHAAIRLVLPILPALAASSPMMELQATGQLDNRLEVYRNNCRRIPSVTGRVIPEAVFTKADYEREILGPMYRDIAPFDPEGILQYEWLNARGAIARFERDTIEVRVLDVQECPQADLAILWAAYATIQGLVYMDNDWSSTAHQQSLSAAQLERIFLDCVARGEEALISDRDYLKVFAVLDNGRVTAGDLWKYIAAEIMPGDIEFSSALNVIFEQGPLARRILRALGPSPTFDRTREMYGSLCDCLAEGRMFRENAMPGFV
ncbi:MAG: glutamate-cysteine ligase family protein [FCB group bacterium]|jgi:gamma-glutamyl:cysteine ligase YbdK (ATP-grasp superfamily)|nr:glutamate-cysteine ligase family protein [FCB group bacterium]